MDGMDACSQRLLQVRKHIHAGVLRRFFIQQLLEGICFNQDHHVLHEVAFNVGRKLRGTQELWSSE